MQKYLKHEWAIVSCQCSRAEEETCSWIFFQNGTLGLEIESLNGADIRIKASFAADSLFPKHLDDLRSQFEQADLAQIAGTLKAEALAEQDWLSNWKKYFLPFIVGKTFLVCPPWKTSKVVIKDRDKRKKIIIDPGMAFGTGQHVTTKFCLRAIEKWAKGPNILDVGTGSGILAIASSMTQPVSQVVAIDIDENSIVNAKHNFELNNLENVIDLHQLGPQALPEGQFNTILSNLTAETIIDLLPTYNNLLASGGIVILAGIIEERLSWLETVLSRYNWQSLNTATEKGWIGMILRKGSA